MRKLFEEAEKVAERLVARGDTLAVAESSTGGILSAALLAVPGASRYFIGGGVVYTRVAKQTLLGLSDADVAQARSASEPHAQILADAVRRRLDTTWGLAETGATGPSGNRYGDAPGHTCMAISGPTDRVLTLETGHGDRRRNMEAFALRALQLLGECLDTAR